MRRSIAPARWSADDVRAFADRDVLKADTVPARRRPAPEVAEWADEIFDMIAAGHASFVRGFSR